MQKLNSSARWGRIVMGAIFFLLVGAGVPFMYGNFSWPVVNASMAFIIVLLVGLAKRGIMTVSDWLVLFMVLIPFHGFKIGSESVFLRLTEIVFIPLAVWWVAQRRVEANGRPAGVIQNEYVILIFFFLFSFMSSVGKSVLPFISVVRTLLLAYLAVVSFMFADVQRDMQKVWYFLRAMMVISATTGVVALLQSFFPVLCPFGAWPFTQIGPIVMARGGAGWENPGYYGLYLVGIMSITISCLLSRQFPDQTRFLKRCLVLQTIGLVSSYSRGSLFALFAGGLFLLWSYGKRLTALMILLVVVLSFFFMTVGIDIIYEKYPYLAAYFFRIGRVEWIKKEPSLIFGYRFEAWQVYMRMFLHNPILGVGPFAGRVHYNKYAGDDIPYRGWPTAPHNEFLSILSERGLLGFCSFMLFLTTLLSHGYHRIRRHPNSPESAVLRGTTAAVICFLVFSLGGASIYDIQFWLNVGMMVAVGGLLSAKQSLDAVPSPR